MDGGVYMDTRQQKKKKNIYISVATRNSLHRYRDSLNDKMRFVFPIRIRSSQLRRKCKFQDISVDGL